MNIADFSRKFFLDVTADGAVLIRKRGEPATLGLPVFTTDTYDEADQLRVQFCRLARDGSGVYRLNEPPTGVDSLYKVTVLFRVSYDTRKKS